MKTMSVNISKQKVYDEVAKTTSYIGAKSVSENVTYNNVFTTDDDSIMLDRFWNEAGSDILSRLSRYVQSGTFDTDSGDFSVTFRLSSRCNDSLTATAVNPLFSYFVNYITGKWMQFINGESASVYLGLSEVSVSELISIFTSRTRE